MICLPVPLPSFPSHLQSFLCVSIFFLTIFVILLTAKKLRVSRHPTLTYILIKIKHKVSAKVKGTDFPLHLLSDHISVITMFSIVFSFLAQLGYWNYKVKIIDTKSCTYEFI